MEQKDPLLGQKIGNYQITVLISSGAFGVVYQARHEYLADRLAAIKILHTHLHKPQDQQQFLQEARILETLQHPHILPILDVGVHQQFPYIITPYAPGGSLRDLLHRHPQPFTLAELEKFLQPLGEALQYAHEQGIIHRDLKPENILIGKHQHLYLADFGIASILSTTSKKYTSVVGTPNYMAPEQFRGIVSPQSDQYALACIIYELFTAQKVFDAPDFISIGMLHATEAPLPPSQINPRIPSFVEEALLKALTKKRDDRYESILAFVQALRPQQDDSLKQNEAKQFLAHLLQQVDRLRDKENNEGVIAICNTIIHLDPKHFLAYFCKAEGLSELERYEEAISMYDKALELDPRHSNAYHNKGYALDEIGEYEEALKMYDKALEFDHQDSIIYHNKGYSLKKLGRYAEAIKMYDKALEIDPYNSDTYSNQSLVLNSIGRYEEAISLLNQALEIGVHNGDIYNNKGYALTKLGNYKAAVKMYNRALEFNDHNSNIYNNKGYALTKLGNYEEAIEMYDKAIEMNAQNDDFYANKGYALKNIGRHAEASICFQRAEELESTS